MELARERERGRQTDRQTERDRERQTDRNNITSVFISNHVTFKWVILEFVSFALKIECLSMYRIIAVFRRRAAKEKVKQIKKSGK